MSDHSDPRGQPMTASLEHNHPSPECCCQFDPRDVEDGMTWDRIYPLVHCPACPMHPTPVGGVNTPWG